MEAKFEHLEKGVKRLASVEMKFLRIRAGYALFTAKGMKKFGKS